MPKYGFLEPSHQVQYTGKTAVITCHSKFKPLWLKDGVPVKHYGSDQQLIIHKLKENDTGIYVCRGYIATFKKFMMSSKLVVGSKIVKYL